jgi:hypothetical protein
MTLLESLGQYTTVVADTGDIGRLRSIVHRMRRRTPHFFSNPRSCLLIVIWSKKQPK